MADASYSTSPGALEAMSKVLHDISPHLYTLPSSAVMAHANHHLDDDDDGDKQQLLHVVMVPYPLQGHINPMVQFAKALVAKHPHTRVTIVNNKHNHDRIQQTRSRSLTHGGHCTSKSTLSMRASSIHSHDQQHTPYKNATHEAQQVDKDKLQFLWVEDGLPPDFDYTDIAPRLWDLHHTITHKMKEPLKQLLQSLNQRQPAVSCVVFGSFNPWVHTACDELAIPSVFFWTQSATLFSIYYHLPLLEANGFFPYNKRASSGCHDDELHGETPQETAASREMVSYVPGVPPLRPSCFPTLLHVDSLSDASIVAIKEQFAILPDCQGVIVNSFKELEMDTYQALQPEFPIPVWLVGPLIPSAFLEAGDKNDTSVGASLLQEQTECIDWLNNQKKHSVLYVSFGSLFTPPTKDIQNIACGIRESRLPFLWVIRPTSSVANVADILPDGFMDDTKDHGLIVPWAPQVKVLSHPAVGAFLTHCGWNSTLESVSMGVPMIPFPIFSDQPTNCAYVCDVWKAGMALERQADGEVRSTDVERAVKTVLEEEGGDVMRKRAHELKEAARHAVRSQGSSDMHMHNFILSMRKMSIH